MSSPFTKKLANLWQFTVVLEMSSASYAAISAVVFSLVALIACVLFVPALVAKINAITNDLEQVSIFHISH
jgi:hypothetical protein